MRKVATFTEERRTGYNEGRQYAAQLAIMGRAEAENILSALRSEHTQLDVCKGDTPYAQSFRKGFARRLIERCEFYLCHADD